MRTIKKETKQRVIISYTFFESFTIKIIPYLKLISMIKICMYIQDRLLILI